MDKGRIASAMSIGFTLAFALLITVAFGIAQHPNAKCILLHRAPGAAAVRTALAWVYEKSAGKRGPAAHRLAVHMVASPALLVGWTVVSALAAGITAVSDRRRCSEVGWLLSQL